MIIEMFYWEQKGDQFFPEPEQGFFHKTTDMAANQGLYNGFLGAGLIWSLLINTPTWSFNIALFFIVCMIIAALYGFYSVDKSILYKQGLPAIITLILLLIGI